MTGISSVWVVVFFFLPSSFPILVHENWEPESQTELSHHAHDKEHLQSLGALP